MCLCGCSVNDRVMLFGFDVCVVVCVCVRVCVELCVLCEICCVMLHGVLCVVVCVVFVCSVFCHVKYVCFGDSLCEVARHVFCVRV